MPKESQSRSKKSDCDTLDIIYYNHKLLKEEGRVACKDCRHVSGKRGESCLISEEKDTQPEEFYWTLGGAIIGCKHGEEMKDGPIG